MRDVPSTAFHLRHVASQTSEVEEVFKQTMEELGPVEVLQIDSHLDADGFLQICVFYAR